MEQSFKLFSPPIVSNKSFLLERNQFPRPTSRPSLCHLPILSWIISKKDIFWTDETKSNSHQTNITTKFLSTTSCIHQRSLKTFIISSNNGSLDVKVEITMTAWRHSLKKSCPGIVIQDLWNLLYRVSKNALSEWPFCENGFDGTWPSTDCFTAVEGYIPSKPVSQNGNP